MDEKRAAQKVSPAEVRHLIDQGSLIVIHEGLALKLDKWIDKHPGGRLAILHMVGRDASDEINAYVPSSPSLAYLALSLRTVPMPGPRRPKEVLTTVPPTVITRTRRSRP